MNFSGDLENEKSIGCDRHQITVRCNRQTQGRGHGL